MTQLVTQNSILQICPKTGDKSAFVLKSLFSEKRVSLSCSPTTPGASFGIFANLC